MGSGLGLGLGLELPGTVEEGELHARLTLSLTRTLTLTRGLPALDACRYLIAKAALCWRNFEGDYRDDITAIVVYLQDVATALEQEREPVS